MKVLTFTTLFPNRQQPTHGLFVRERVLALAGLVDLRVVAPVPWFPPTRVFGDRYYRYSQVPSQEEHGGTAVEHPRFAVIPKFFKATDGALLASGALPCVRRLWSRFPFDIIDAHWAYPDGVAAARLAGYLKVPLSITVRGDDINIFMKEAGRGPWIRRSLRKADLVIALSNELKDIVVAAGVPPAKVAVIPNGINADRFQPTDRATARARLGLPEHGRFILSVGRLHESKGYPTLVSAAARLVAAFPDISVYIVGPPDHEADARPAILETAVRHGFEDRLFLVGAQDPSLLRYWYGAADLFCLPTTREGSANVLLEAMACGLPCVTTPVGGNPEAVSSPEVGYLVEANAETMAEALASALTRPWDTARISEHGRRRTWQTVATECQEHFAMAIAMRKAGGPGRTA